MDRSHSVPIRHPSDSTGERTRPLRRPSVRIVERYSISRAAKVSIVMTAAAAAVAFAAWRWWQPPPPLTVARRSVSHVDLPWRCEAGHSFTAQGQTGDRLCASCAMPAYPVATYECKQHGPFEVAVKLKQVSDAVSVASQWRLGKGDWVPVESDLHCPRCETVLVRRPADPGEAAVRAHKKPGG